MKFLIRIDGLQRDLMVAALDALQPTDQITRNECQELIDMLLRLAKSGEDEAEICNDFTA